MPNPRILCPHCGYDGSTKTEAGGTFLYLEDIVVFRAIRGLKRVNGVLELKVAAQYGTGEGYDDGANGRLECRRCLSEFVPPEDWVIDWV